MPNVDKHVIRRRETGHTGQCKSTGGYLQRPGVGFFPHQNWRNAKPTVIIMFV